ncbi:hypothetical protein MIND_01047500 [Mycena indigotica]|uniref:Uncharacterized protein n=1 Tax=Mycena indigotica TaxID=2126181 RepID=A0A8H6SB58_9AGAR|nr:uncharacterized protein MIND_01047500 [Mycena indigotica]KAF7295092.1 hypothetical protein MIND_01047500 [Mycena indigotica]
MSLQPYHYRTEATGSTRTYSRPLGPNELSYFLPSRANGLNDIYTRVIFRAPPTLISPFRLRVVWAIIRIRNSLLASRIEMPPGRYSESRFVYNPPSSPQEAFEEAGFSLSIQHGKSGVELDNHFIFGQRELSHKCLSRMYVCQNGENEFHMAFSSLHSITDGTSANIYTILQLLGGSETSGGRVRSDEELFRILEKEWSLRWRNSWDVDSFYAITPSAESRLPFPNSRFQIAAWKVDSMNVQRRAIGGHAFPRLPSSSTKQAHLEMIFSSEQTFALASKCASEKVNIPNAIFALCNLAWLRTAESRGAEFSATYAPPSLPTLFYTAVSLRRHLEPVPDLTSPLALALGYATVVLPGFLPRGDQKKSFWLRARNAQKQMRTHIKSPMFLPRAQILAVQRGKRAKMFAKMDDEGTPIPPTNTTTSQTPSVALMGISHLGDLCSSYHPSSYPAIQFVDSVGHSRKAPGGILLFTRIAAGNRFALMLEWDAAAFPAGLVDEFWANFLRGVDEFVLEEGDSRRDSSKL